MQNNENELVDFVDENSDIKEFQQTHDKKVVKNIILVAVSNILTLLAGILVGFVLPKIMTKVDYGYYKTFTLYFGYIGLFHFGFIDGIYLVYAGKKYKDLNFEKFRLYTRLLIVFQFIISLVISLISLFFINKTIGIVFLCLGVNIIFNSLTCYYQFISQITGRFKELSFRNIIKAILTCVSILVLTLLFYFNILSNISYVLYIVIFTVIQVILTLWYIYTYKDITFGKSLPFKDELYDIKKLFKVGIPLLIANIVSSLILTIDRQFVSLLFNIEIYAVYAFAYNMLSLITTVISAISTVLYPTIKTYSEDRLKNDYNRLMAIITIIVGFCIGSYYPLKFILEKFLPQYVDSLQIFRIILPSLLISSSISMIMFNYYKSLNKQLLYFIISLIILFMSALANAIAYLLFQTTIAISIASVIIMGLWYIWVELLIIRRFKINPLNHILYIICIMLIFYVLSYMINNEFVGFFVYLLFYIIFSIVFYFNFFKNRFKFI